MEVVMSRKKWMILTVLSCFCFSVQAAVMRPVPAETLLQMTRDRAALQQSYADMEGKVTHLKKNQGGAVNYPIRFVIRFGKEKVQARLLLDKSEVHDFERVLATGKSRTATNKKSDNLLHSLGFRIEELAMNFLEYPVHMELPEDSYKTLKCRVILLRSPDDKPVKVWIASEYLFPMRAEFYDSIRNINGKPERTMEITSFKKVGEYYVATDIALLTAAFRSRIAFSKCSAMSADAPEALEQFPQK